MHAVIRVFCKFVNQKYVAKFNLQKTASGKVVCIRTKKFFPKFEIIRIRNTGAMNY